MFGFQVIPSHQLSTFHFHFFSKWTFHFHLRLIHVDDLFVSSGLNQALPLLIHVLKLQQSLLQKDNVSNQREHLILLLANVHIRRIPKLDQQPKVSSFPTYTHAEVCAHGSLCNELMMLFTRFHFGNIFS